MEQVAGDDRVRRVGLGVEHRAPRLHRVALVRPETREAEVELDDRDLRIELRELLEAIERRLRPRGERRADLRLERVVLGEEGGRVLDLPLLVERGTPGQIPRLGVRSEPERERERGSSLAQLGLGRRRRRACRVAVGGKHRGGHDRDGRDRDGRDEKRDPTPR